MGSQNKIRNAAVWGICAIAAEIIFLTMEGILNESFSPVFQFICLELAVFLCVLALSGHIWGYSYLGKRYNSAMLTYSAQCVVVFNVLFGILLMWAVALQSLYAGSGLEAINALVALSVIAFSIAALIFAISLVMLYKKIGVLAILSIGVAMLPFFVWTAWPMVIFLIPSTVLLFQQSKS